MSGAFPYVIRLKQGTTLMLDLFFADDNGAAIDISVATVSLLIADPLGGYVASPTVAPGAEMGWGTVVADTAGWPHGTLPAQTQLAAFGATIVSDTFHIVVERGVRG